MAQRNNNSNTLHISVERTENPLASHRVNPITVNDRHHNIPHTIDEDPLDYLQQTIISRRQKFHPTKSLTLNTSTLVQTTCKPYLSELTPKPKTSRRPFHTTSSVSQLPTSAINVTSSYNYPLNFHKDTSIYDDNTPTRQLTASPLYSNQSPPVTTTIRSHLLRTSPTENYSSDHCRTSRHSSISSLSSTDRHVPLASPSSIHPWPLPPTSAKFSKFPVHPDWPQKSSTYYPLRTWSTAPRPLPSDITSPLSRSASATLAYLDLCSAPAMSHRTGNASPPSTQPSQSLGNICHPASLAVNQSWIPTTSQNSTLNVNIMRPTSSISLKSTASKETFYQDAPDTAEWMEIDSGDAYDDLEKAESTVRKMRESLLRMPVLQLTPGARTRFQAMLENEKLHDFSNLFSLTAGPPTIHSPPLTPSPQSTSFLYEDQKPLGSHRKSYASSKTLSSSTSYRSFKSSFELDRHYSTRTDMHRLSAVVPVFTRIMGGLRDQDRGEGKGNELTNSIPGASSQGSPDPGNIRVTGSPSSLGGSSYKRRLKPLILRTSGYNNFTNPKRSSAGPFVLRYSLPPESTSSRQPILHKAHSLRVSNQDRWDSSQKSSDDATLKEDSETLSEPRASGEESTRRFTGEQSKLRFQEVINDPIMNNLSDHGESPEKETAKEQASLDQIPVIKYSKQRSGTFGVHSSKVWAIGQGSPPLVKKISSESLEPLTVEDDCTTDQQSHDHCADDNVDTEEAETSIHNPENQPVGSRSSLKKNLSPIKTQFFSSVRQRTISHQLTTTGFSKDPSVMSKCAPLEDSQGGSRSSGSPRHRTRCLSNLYKSSSKNVPTPDRGVSAASYAAAAAAAKLAERKASQTLELTDSPDTLIISGVPYDVRVGAGKMPDSQQVEEVSLEQKKQKSAEGHVSRLFMTLSRMQARDASKVLDLGPAQLERDCVDHRRFMLHAQGHPKFIKGKLQRISKPVILQADDERVALWRMISNAKPSPVLKTTNPLSPRL